MPTEPESAEQQLRQIAPATSFTTRRGGMAVRCIEVGMTYHLDGTDVVALTDVDLDIAGSESVALFGPSGSGKSTLTALLAGLRRCTSGEVWLGDNEVNDLTESELLRLRGRQIGIVVQNPSRSLLPYGTAEDNIRFSQSAASKERRKRLPDPLTLLDQLGLGHLAGQRAGRLSGGEQQRLSVAVAMSTLPRLLLADEPTSQLDGTNRDLVVELMRQITDTFGATLVTVTHDPVVADATDRRITLAEGRVVDQGHRTATGSDRRRP